MISVDLRTWICRVKVGSRQNDEISVFSDDDRVPTDYRTLSDYSTVMDDMRETLYVSRLGASVLRARRPIQLSAHPGP